MEPVTIEELDRFLTEQSVDFEILHHSKPIRSRYDALKLFRLEEMAPTLIVKTEKGMFALIVSGDREQLDLKKIGEMIGCSQVEMAGKEEVFERLGMKTGEIALVGHRLPCLIDNRIFQNDYVFGGAGNAHYTLKIKPEDLVKVNKVIFRFN